MSKIRYWYFPILCHAEFDLVLAHNCDEGLDVPDLTWQCICLVRVRVRVISYFKKVIKNMDGEW